MPYWAWMTAGTVLIFALYGLRCARAERVPALRQRPWLTALLSLIFSVLFGLPLARIGYALLMQELDFAYDGWGALEYLLEIEVDLMSFFCGALGVCLGVLLANRLTRRKAVLAGMDAFAPFGALLIALFRLGEISFGSWGAGEILPEGSPFAFFPLALNISVDGGYSYHGWAICVFSAFFALVWAVIAFFRLRSRGRTGLSLTLTLFFLALPQILCESLRKRGLFWLFVHTEQVLCAAVLLGVLLLWVLGADRKIPLLRRLAPLLITVLCFGLIVVTEFAIDGKIFDLTHGVCYAVMTVLLVIAGCCGASAARRWNSAKE